MNPSEILKRVTQAVRKVRPDLSVADLKPEKSLIEDLGFDSMSLVALAGELESIFEKSLPLSDWVGAERDKGLKLGSLLQFLEQALK